MKRFMPFLPLLALVAVLTACTSTQRGKYNTLIGLARTVDTAETSYLVAYFTGKVATNDFPRIQGEYSTFQGTFASELAAAHYQSNSAAPVLLIGQAAVFTGSVTAAIAKGKK